MPIAAVQRPELNLRVYQKVLWLDVTVNDVGSVAKGDTFNHLIGEVPESFGLQTKIDKFKISSSGMALLLQEFCLALQLAMMTHRYTDETRSESIGEVDQK